MAPCGFPFVLALEVATSWWSATSSAGNTQTDPRDEHRHPLWGAPRIHGELLKLDIAIGQTSVAKYMAKRRGPPSQGWKTFLRNHADGIAALDLFVAPTTAAIAVGDWANREKPAIRARFQIRSVTSIVVFRPAE
jgi:hypothetical protein